MTSCLVNTRTYICVLLSIWNLICRPLCTNRFNRGKNHLVSKWIVFFSLFFRDYFLERYKLHCRYYRLVYLFRYYLYNVYYQIHGHTWRWLMNVTVAIVVEFYNCWVLISLPFNITTLSFIRRNVQVIVIFVLFILSAVVLAVKMAWNESDEHFCSHHDGDNCDIYYHYHGRPKNCRARVNGMIVTIAIVWLSNFISFTQR